MRRKKLAAVATAALVSAALTLPLTASEVGAAPSARPSASQASAQDSRPSDNRVPKWRAKYDGLKQAALERQLRQGTSKSVEKLGRGKYARVTQSGNDRIFVVLAEYGNTRHEDFCDSTDENDCLYPSDGTPQRYDGPQHNQIPEPDRKLDNSTLWEKNYNRKYYQDLYSQRLRKFYEDQSSGRYSVDGDVTAWVKVPFNAARYGRDYCGDVICKNVEFLVRDALSIWTQDQLDSGKTMDEVQEYLKTFDKQDRYDYDEDGDFNEPDGYIDHFQIVHSGGDQADGDPINGTDAIWSHRGNLAFHPKDDAGPVGGPQLGGIEVGEGGTDAGANGPVELPDNPTGVWVTDYTMQPENGGLNTVAHEFGHDLGLPDLYDTGFGVNSIGFWDLMDQSRGTAKGDEGIGDRAMPFGAWDKFQLGWLDYQAVHAGRSATVQLRPGQSLSKRKHNGAVVILPDKVVQLALGDPCPACGERFYWSNRGNDLDNTMELAVDGGGELNASVRYTTEDGWDYAFLEGSSDDGETWEPIETSESYVGEDSSGFNGSGFGISGTSDDWVDLTATVPDGTDAIRWRYLTDGAFALDGFQVDNITLDGTLLGDAEEDDDGWTLDGFRRTTGSDTLSYLNAYFVDNRQYVGRDKLLKHLYSYIGYQGKRFNKVEFYRAEPGALVSYWDTSYSDNDIGDHPGGGELLIVDAHPEFDHYPTGDLTNVEKLAYDAPFSLKPSRDVHLHSLARPYTIEGQAASPTFNDLQDWWFPNDEHTVEGEHPGYYQPSWASVDVPDYGVKVKVVKVAKNHDMTVRVSPAG